MNRSDNPKYDGTIHPEEWVKQIQLRFYDKNNENIRNEQEFVNYCKLLIHPSIKILPETNSIIGLVNDLKTDISYNIFKKSIKRKLQFNYSISKNKHETLKFLNHFQQLLYEGEITEFGEQKKIFLNTLQKESIQHAFISHKFDKINSMEELFKYFYESFVEELKIIKNGSYIALKHVATGKYLTSDNDLVFAGSTIKDLNSVWIISEKQESTRYNQLGKFLTVFYGDLFDLKNKKNDLRLYVSNYGKSPATKHRQVSCKDESELWHCMSTNYENPPYVRNKDIINLQSNRIVLRSHEFTFNHFGETYQEVVGHKERIGGNDEWCIEIIELDNDSNKLNNYGYY
ncbi:hypothetical protein C1645_342737 [Glomus cerebriforme]|uniref:MIR domain-containing protein n=1 Tax=Glomus cerebriforme TaxID=658196 RepID=A0A397SU27_9GLOM|nr:hypothetical protein C1645_342737 [Glomus cerebriforme]